MTDDLFYATRFIVQETESWLAVAETQSTYSYRRGFGLAPIDIDLLTLDPSTQRLFSLIGEVKPRIIKTPPGYFFDWHVDTEPFHDRQCVLNITLTPGLGKTLFRKSTTIHQRWLNVFEVPYEINRWYLLNTSKKHCFMNLSDRDRYTISVDIKGQYYEAVLEKLK